MAILLPNGKQSFNGVLGLPLVGGKLYTYAAGTNTPQATYTDAAGTVPNANPIILDARGEATVFWNGNYKIVLRDALDNLIWTIDNVTTIDPLIAQFNTYTALLTGPTGAAQIGFLQSGVGAVARTVQARARERVSVKDFGALGDNATDDTAAIAAAYTAARAATIGEVFWPDGTYLTTAQIDASNVSTVGTGRGSVKIKASVAIAGGVIKLAGQNSRIENVYVDANRLTQYGINAISCNGSQIRNCQIENSLLDAIYFAASGNNNNAAVLNCLIGNVSCGTIYSTGTAANGAAGTVATLTGAIDQTTRGIRVGFDYIRVGTADARLITGVASNSITFYPPIAGAQSGVAYSIRQGSGIGMPAHSDNSAIKIMGNTIQAAAVAGIQDQGLFGAVSIGNVIEFCEMGRVIGRRLGSFEVIAVGSQSIGDYYESCPSGNIVLESVSELRVSNPVLGSALTSSLDAIRIIDPATIYNASITLNGQTYGKLQSFVLNTASFNALFGITYAIETGVGNCTVNLPIPVAGSNAETFLNSFDNEIVVTTHVMSGASVVFKAPSGNVNSIIGTTGVTLAGDNKRYTCRYRSNLGWTVS